MYRKIIAVFMACMVVATTLVSPVFATDYQSTYSFWNWLYDNGWFVGRSIASLSNGVCSVSDDTMHHATVPSGGFAGIDRDGVRLYTCVCDYCAQEFTATATELENTYNDWDSERGYDTVDSNGAISGFGEWTTWCHTFIETGVSLDSTTQLHVTVTGTSGTGKGSYSLCYLFSVPYDCTVVFEGAFERIKDDGTISDAYKGIGKSSASSPTNCSLTTSYVDGVRTFSAIGGQVYRYTSGTYTVEPKTTVTRYFNIPRIYIQLDDPVSNLQEIPVFSVGDVVVDLSSYDSWAFDYTTRTFTGYTEVGDVKIVYGDENVTVIEGGNTRNYYYASADGDGSGSGSGSGDGSGGDGLLGKLGELLGTFLGGIIDLITGVLNRILDSLITLAEMTLEKLGNIVNLFGSFGDALRSLWSWLPADVIEVLVAGVTVIVFCAVIKLFV